MEKWKVSSVSFMEIVFFKKKFLLSTYAESNDERLSALQSQVLILSKEIRSLRLK